jgi:hypothetical protein
MIKRWKDVSVLSILLLGTFAVSANESQAQRIFAFADDFHKPACCQRDGWEERIETERHDFTQSATTVGRGILQVESGYSYFHKDREEDESIHTLPELMLRWGLSEDIEFRVRWNYVWIFEEEEPGRTGSEDLRYSLKLQITRPEHAGLLPTSALEIRGTAPTGGEAFSTNGGEFGLDYIYQWRLSERMTFAGSTGFGTNGLGDLALFDPDINQTDDFIVISQTAVIGMDLSERNTMYSEWFGLFSDGRAEAFSISFFNIGLDHYLTDNLVVDLRIGVGLTQDSDDFFCGVGGGYRF